METQSALPDSLARRKRFPWRFALAGLLIGGCLFYLLQPRLLAWWIGQSLQSTAHARSWRLHLGKIEADFFSGKAVVQDIELKDLGNVANFAEIAEVTVDFSPWRVLFERNLSPIRKIALGKTRVAWTGLDSAAGKKATGSDFSARNYFPDALSGSDFSADLTFANTRLEVENAEFNFLPNAAGEINISHLTAMHAPWKRRFSGLEGVTSIKERGLYVGGIKFAENLVLERAAINFNDPGKGKITSDALFSAFGGGWRTDLDFDRQKSSINLEAAAFFWNLSVSQLGMFLGNADLADGTIHEGRLTFRGNPENPAEASTVLRLNATDFRWHERRWNSLVASAILVNRRIEIPQFDLVQEKNQIQLKGTAELPEKWTQLPAEFQFQVLAQLDDLHLASLLILPNQKAIEGEAFFAGEVRNQKGRFSGNLKMRGGPLQLSGISIDRVRGDLDLQGSEISATAMEFARGPDKASGWMTVNLAEPRRYSGELQIDSGNVADYNVILPKAVSDHAVSGGMQLWWSGDGMSGAHSGAFKASLHHFLLSRSQEAVPLDLVSHGTYSPAGIAFNSLVIHRPQARFETTLLVREDLLELRDLKYSGSGGSTLSGHITLPLNLLAALNQPGWEALLNSRSPAAGQLEGSKIRLEEIGEFSGRHLPIRGRMNFSLSASGPWQALETKLDLSLSDLAGPKQIAIPALEASFSLVGNQLHLQSEINPAAPRDHLSLVVDGTTALIPASMARGEFFDPRAPLAGSLKSPRIAVAQFHPWLAVAQPFTGDISADLSLSGTGIAPEIIGSIGLLQTTWQPAWLENPLKKLSGNLQLEHQQIRWNNVQGNYRSGNFEVNGSSGIDPAEPFNFAISGENIPISSATEASEAIADGDVQWTSDHGNSLLAGAITLKSGLFRRELRLSSTPADPQKAFSLPWIPSEMNLALKIDAGQPLEFRGLLAAWSVQPELEISGTAGKPVFVGKLTLQPLLSRKESTLKSSGTSVYFTKTSLEKGIVGNFGFLSPFDFEANPTENAAPSRVQLPLGYSGLHLEILPMDQPWQ